MGESLSRPEGFCVPEPSPTQEHRGPAQPLTSPVTVTVWLQGDSENTPAEVLHYHLQELHTLGEIEIWSDGVVVERDLLDAARAIVKASDDYKTWVSAGVMRALLSYSESDLRKATDKAFADLRAAIAKATGEQG